MQDATIDQLPDLIGQGVRLQGWLTGSRSSGEIAFLQLRDGTGFVQGVIARSDASDDLWNVAKGLSQESSLEVQGEVRADDRSKTGVELQVTGVQVLHAAQDYPITPK